MIVQQTLGRQRILKTNSDEISFADLDCLPLFSQFKIDNIIDKEIEEQAEIHVKYAGYIEKEKNNADKLNRLENVKIPEGFDFYKLQAVSIEAKQKLTKIQPTTIAQASRISGVSPSDVSVLLVYMGRQVPRGTEKHMKNYYFI